MLHGNFESTRTDLHMKSHKLRKTWVLLLIELELIIIEVGLIID